MPLKKNDEIIVKIDNLNDDGAGVARYEGKVIFVPNTLPSEKVKVHIIADKSSFYIGKLLDILEPSSKREKPKCKYFEKCGGCELQHLNETAQEEYKRNKVSQALSKFAKIDVIVPPVVFTSLWGYRNKVAFPVNKEGNIGMYKRSSHNIVDIDDCLISKPYASKVITAVRNYMQKEQVPGYDEETQKGLIRHIVSRELNGNVLVTIVINGDTLPSSSTLVDELKKQFDSFGLNYCINKKPGNVILGDKWKQLYGFSAIESEKYGIKYSISNASFLQVNDEIRDIIYDKILDEIDSDDSVIDAYSGAGLLTAFISKKAKNAIGVEIIKEATDDADRLATTNQLKNIKNINGDCSKVLPELVKQIDKKDLKIIIDPPRKGCDKSVLDAIVSASPLKIIYLSCNPITLARDLTILCAGGYKLEKITAYDMFPQTSHVETLCVLKNSMEKA